MRRRTSLKAHMSENSWAELKRSLFCICLKGIRMSSQILLLLLLLLLPSFLSLSSSSSNTVFSDSIMLRLPPVLCIGIVLDVNNATGCMSDTHSFCSFFFVRIIYSLIRFVLLRLFQFRQITLNFARSFNTWPCSRKRFSTQKKEIAMSECNG